MSFLILTEDVKSDRTSDPEKQQEPEEVDVQLCQHSEGDKEEETANLFMQRTHPVHTMKSVHRRQTQ